MRPHPVALHDTPSTPWRNGGGFARDLLAWPDGADWRLRISVAEIERDGPFSAYPGIERRFAVVLGGGVALTIDGVEHLCRPGDEALQFSGAAGVGCRLLGGPSRALNLLLRDLPGTMEAVVDGESWTPARRQCGVYAVAEGRCVAGTEVIDMPAESLLWFTTAPRTLSFTAGRVSHGPVIGWWLAADIAGPEA